MCEPSPSRLGCTPTRCAPTWTSLWKPASSRALYRNGRRRGARVFSFAPPGAVAEGSYKVLAEVLASGIRDGEPAPGAVAAKAGRRWGQHLEQQGGASAEPVDSGRALDRIVALLDDVGFAPQIGEPASPTTNPGGAGSATVIELHRCPFYEIARGHTEVVCAVHLGLIQGALDQMQAPPLTVRLEPFVRPDLCLVNLAPAVIDGAEARS
jgi:predicted ArsR family transcriptional regulator